ncbi:FtsB family cell division protein [Bartonella sp. LJL80]
MWTKQKRRSIKGRFVLPLMTIGVLGYFGYHIYHGEYGLYSRVKVEQHIDSLNAELTKLETERLGIEKKVALLKDGHIERDMLDEYARKNLNLSKPNELVILTSPGDLSN